MAKLFNISVPPGDTNLKLRAKQKMEVTYTVSNLSGRNVRGRVVLKPDDPPVKNKWVTITEESEKDFGENGTFQFKVTINMPADAAPGKYTFRLDAVNASIPDEGDSGPAIGFEVLGGEKRPFPKWIFPVAAVVLLLVVGLGAWMLWPKAKHTPAPNPGHHPPGTQFEVTRVLMQVAPRSYQGSCPNVFQFEGAITVTGSGTVRYTFVRSDGATGPTNTLDFNEPGPKSVSTSWRLGAPGMTFEGWEAIKIIAPNGMTSNNASFTLKCA